VSIRYGSAGVEVGADVGVALVAMGIGTPVDVLSTSISCPAGSAPGKLQDGRKTDVSKINIYTRA
jgi:hypothetical protein